jgi:hypothetical protein
MDLDPVKLQLMIAIGWELAQASLILYESGFAKLQFMVAFCMKLMRSSWHGSGSGKLLLVNGLID